MLLGQTQAARRSAASTRSELCERPAAPSEGALASRELPVLLGRTRGAAQSQINRVEVTVDLRRDFLDVDIDDAYEMAKRTQAAVLANKQRIAIRSTLLSNMLESPSVTSSSEELQEEENEAAEAVTTDGTFKEFQGDGLAKATPACFKCVGSGQRGLFGPSGMGLLRRKCRHCAAAHAGAGCTRRIPCLRSEV